MARPARVLKKSRKNRPPEYGLLCGRRFEDELGCHRDRCLQASVNRTFICKDAVHARSRLPMSFLSSQSHSHVNASDHKYILLELDLTHCFPDQAPGGRVDLTRLQRASEGSRQSTRCRRDHVIERGRPRFRDRRRDVVMPGYGTM
jgi:hypothetical protein